MRTSLSWAPEIPDHWEVVPLNAVAKMGTGHTPDRSKPEYWENCTIPWVTTPDVTRRPDSLESLLETEQSISELGSANSAAVVHSSNTVMLSRTASVGFSVLIGRPMATTQAFVTWKAGSRLDPRYLLLVLRAMKPEWERLAYGSTHLTIYMPDLESLRIPLPPIEEQRRIAALAFVKVRQFDELASLQRKVRESIVLRLQAQRDQVVEELASRWGTVTLRRLATSFEQGTSPQCFDSEAPMDSWGVLKVSAIKQGRFVESENKQLPPGASPEERYEIRDGDLLVTRANTPNLVGATAVARGPRPKLILSDKIFRLRTVSSTSRDFIEFVSGSTRIRSMCAQASHGTSASMANLKTEEVKSWPIPDAPPSIQRAALSEFDEARRVSDALTNAIRSQLILLAERRQALIAGLVVGQLGFTTARGVGA